jgi:CubicO group peptidase (beta-lactamase class C family)
MAGWILTVERQDMQSIDRFVAEQLAAWEVPGCAAVAVQDGLVVLAAGWGSARCAITYRNSSCATPW